MEARLALDCKRLGDVLNLVQDFVTPSGQDSLQYSSNGSKVAVDVMNFTAWQRRFDRALFQMALSPYQNPWVFFWLRRDIALAEHEECIPVELATIPIANVANLHHQVNQVLNAEYPIVCDRILLVYGLDEAPVLLHDLYVPSVDPIIAAHHQCLKE